MAAAKKGLGVTGAVAVIRLKDGSDRYLYKGAVVVPDLFDEKSLNHVKGLGLVSEIDLVEDTSVAEEEPYKGVTVADLTAEIEKRNADRADDKKITPADAKRPQLVAALVADDAAKGE
jgi:hypothetical protein